MPQFQYVALNERGQEVRGKAEGADARSVATALRGRSLFVVRIEQALNAVESAVPRSTRSLGDLLSAVGRGYSRMWSPRTRHRVFFFQQLSLMLRTGLTLLQALDVARDQCGNPQLGLTIERLRQHIQAGKSLSQAMTFERRHFSTFTIKLVETAEASGELDRILRQIATFMERRAELMRKLITGLTYPMIVVVASIGVAIFLIIGIIPKFSAFFARRQAALPWSTQVLVDLSDWIQLHGLTIVAVLGVSITSLVLFYMTRPGRLLIDRLTLSIPVVGPLLSTGAMAQFCQTMSLLLGSGVTLLETLRITATVINNRAISEAIGSASEQILRGQDLTRSLTLPVVPRLVTQVVAVGERTGSLAQVLEELHEFYDKQLQASIQRLAAWLEPVMILVVGAMVGFVYFSFFQALFQLATAGR